jgi:hypothetical protein
MECNMGHGVKQELLLAFLLLFVVLGHVQVGNFFLVFSLHTHHFQGDTIKSRQRFDHVLERKKGDSNESILPS